MFAFEAGDDLLISIFEREASLPDGCELLVHDVLELTLGHAVAVVHDRLRLVLLARCLLVLKIR